MRVGKGMKPNWPRKYTILKVASMTPQPLETYALYKESCRLCRVQCMQCTEYNVHSTSYKMRFCDWDCTFDDVITCDAIPRQSLTISRAICQGRSSEKNPDLYLSSKHKSMHLQSWISAQSATNCFPSVSHTQNDLDVSDVCHSPLQAEAEIKILAMGRTTPRIANQHDNTSRQGPGS